MTKEQSNKAANSSARRLVIQVGAFLLGGLASFCSAVWLFPLWLELDLLKHLDSRLAVVVWMKATDWGTAFAAGLLIGLFCRKHWISVGIFFSAGFIVLPHLVIPLTSQSHPWSWPWVEQVVLSLVPLEFAVVPFVYLGIWIARAIFKSRKVGAIVGHSVVT